MDAGRFQIQDLDVAVTMAAGALIALGQLLQDHPDRDAEETTDRVTEELLRLFGVRTPAARRICRLPLPALGPHSRPDLTIRDARIEGAFAQVDATLSNAGVIMRPPSMRSGLSATASRTFPSPSHRGWAVRQKWWAAFNPVLRSETLTASPSASPRASGAALTAGQPRSRVTCPTVCPSGLEFAQT